MKVSFCMILMGSHKKPGANIQGFKVLEWLYAQVGLHITAMQQIQPECYLSLTLSCTALTQICKWRCGRSEAKRTTECAHVFGFGSEAKRCLRVGAWEL